MGATWSPFSLASAGVQALHPYEPGKPLSELYREYGISGAIKLASNENPHGAGRKAQAAAVAALADPARYPDGNGFGLKQALAEWHGVSASRITLGNGSNDVLELIARVFLTPVHSAVFSQYAFAAYPIVTQAAGAQAHIAPAQGPESGMSCGHDLDAMLNEIDSTTRVVFIANPNNPTGTWIEQGTLRRFLEAVSNQVMVVVDEAYFEYVSEPDYPDTTLWIDEFPNLIVTRTFSKAYGLAGLRVGYSISHPEVADLLNRVRLPFNVNLAAQAAAVAALEDREHIRMSVEANAKGIALWRGALDRMGIGYIPTVGNFITVDTGQPAGRIYEALLGKGVVVRPIGAYGLPNHLRITIGTAAENSRAIAALETVLE